MNDPLGRIETDTEPDGLRLSLFGEVLALSHLKDLPAQLIGETDGWAPVSEPGADLSGR